MKKAIIIFVLAAICASANATVITVSNNVNSPGQYTNLQLAINAAANNDTLFVHGSPNSYDGAIINKPLTIMGAGALPNKDYYFATRLPVLTLSYNILYTSSASGSKIIGCDIEGLVLNGGNGTTAPGISNVVITRNRIQYISCYQPFTTIPGLAHTNISVYNNIIDVINAVFIKNSVIKNNIIRVISPLGNVNAGTVLIANNIILANITTVSNATISNNIFYHTTSTSAVVDATLCSLFNNCFYSTTHSYVLSDIIYGNNTGSNNILNQAPMFVYYNPSMPLNSYTSINPAGAPFTNYNLQTGSPCLLSGSDGTDIGIYGGLSPFVEGYPANSRYRYFPMPAIPQMLQMNIPNPNILPAGTISVDFKARKND